MSSSYYLTVAVFSLLGLWLLWFYGYQEYLSSRFRFRLFRVRSELFSMAASGLVRFDDPAYCGLRFRLNALLRFAHRISFLSLIVALISGPPSPKAESYQARWRVSVAKLPEDAKAQIEGLEQEMVGSFASHIVWGSLVLIPLALLIRLLKVLLVVVMRVARRDVENVVKNIRNPQEVLEIARLNSGARRLEDEAYLEQHENLNAQATLA